MAEFRQNLVDRINDYRQVHSAPQLKLADWLSDYAQDWANRLAKDNQFEHRPLETNKFGENIYYSHKPTGDKAGKMAKLHNNLNICVNKTSCRSI